MKAFEGDHIKGIAYCETVSLSHTSRLLIHADLLETLLFVKKESKVLLDLV